MKRSTRIALWMSGAVVVLAGAGAWAFRQSPGAPVLPTAASILDAVPVAGGAGASGTALAGAVRSTREQPTRAERWVALGDAVMQKARERGDAGYYLHAALAYEEALRLRPRSPDAMAGLAWVAGSRHEFHRSIEWANRALAVDAKNTAAHGLLGDAAVELGDYAAAFRHYQRMLDLRPDLASYSRAGHLLYLSGDVRKGIWLMRKAVETGAPYAENTAWCRAQLGAMLCGWGAYVPAEQVLEDALKRAPENYHVLTALARVKVARKQNARAIELYRQAAALQPHVDTLAALGDLHRAAGNLPEAERQYARVEAVHKLNQANGVQGSASLALFYADGDRNLPEALKLAEAEYRAAGNVYAADTLAWCYYKNGRLQDARRMAANALKQKTPEARFHYHAGMIYARLGQRGPAQRHLARALNLNPVFSPIQAPIAAATLQELGSRPERTAGASPKVR